MRDEAMTGANILLGLGTNLGERQGNLARAIAALGHVGHVTQVSGLFESAPMYVEDQPRFLNLCLGLECDLKPLALLAALKAIEAEVGRTATFRNGPRVIDLDILFYGDQVIESADLILPHPRLTERAFVLAPLCEIAPDRRHPITGALIRDLAATLDRTGLIRVGALA